MPFQFERIIASDGYPLNARHWQPTNEPPCGFVVALHGIQSHSGWYEYSSQRLCEAGYDVLFMDRRGSGRNYWQRGHAIHADRLVNDVAQVLSSVRQRQQQIAPTAPVVLLSVSWGGKLAAIAAARRPDLTDGLALLYPGLFARVQPTIWQRVRLWLARRLGIRQKRVEIPLNDSALFTTESRWQQFIRNDSLALREVTSGFLLVHQDLTRESLNAASRIHCPTLLMLAGRDQIIDNDATKNWARQIGSRDVTLHEYPNAQHTLEFELNPDSFIADLLAWLDSFAARTKDRH